MEVLRKYGESAVILFPLIDAGAADFESTPVSFTSGDTQISKDEAAFANATNNPAHEGNGIYSLTLTAAEMQAARIVVTVIDSATKAWEDQAIVISTYGNASAQHAVDLDDSVRAGLTALPNAAADAAGGLPISDAGGLDMDAILTDTSALNDTKIPDTLSLANINAEVDTALNTAIPGSPTANSINARIAAVDDLTQPGGSGDLAAILADTGTDGVAIATATAQAIADEILKRGVGNVEDTADAHSLAAIVLAVLESAISGTTWTIKKVDGSTTFTTKTVTTDAAADPVTGVT